MIVDKIETFLTKNDTTAQEEVLKFISEQSRFAFKRQFFDPPRESKVSLSQAGNCYKKLWYKHNGVPEAGKEIDSRAKINFFYGDLVEMAIVGLAMSSGVPLQDVGEEQRELVLNLGDETLVGHPDGTLNGELVEFKSMNDFGFREFEKGRISDEYMAQVQVYMHLIGATKCHYVVFNKQSGVMSELTITYREGLYQDAILNLESAVQKEEPAPPEKYNVDAKGFYPWQCLYCAHHEVCRPNAEKVVVSNRYKLKEKQDERVEHGIPNEL